jgi:hypothetical protein
MDDPAYELWIALMDYTKYSHNVLMWEMLQLLRKNRKLPMPKVTKVKGKYIIDWE